MGCPHRAIVDKFARVGALAKFLAKSEAYVGIALSAKQNKEEGAKFHLVKIKISVDPGRL